MRGLPLEVGAGALFVHGHPDDETLSTGGLIALLARAGVAVGVVTATRGERGEVVPGPLAGLAGSPELVEHREGELARAIEALGRDAPRPVRHYYMGLPPARAAGRDPEHYEDSGMRWGSDGLALPALDAPAAALTSRAAADQVDDLLALIDATEPGVVVSYGPLGGYRHPDHMRTAAIARRAAAARNLTYIAVLSAAERAQLSAPEAADVIAIDARPVAGAIAEALRCHASQLTLESREPDLLRLRHSGGQVEERDLTEYYLVTGREATASDRR